ncbi:ADP-ribosyltransferase [Streptomyces sp. NPDC005805]|uniref:ADP-ribosyltransferase n=1 Tax=Streptomyces sp. NPDC005805 TaxID=3157068 RepID=UPI00340560B5
MIVSRLRRRAAVLVLSLSAALAPAAVSTAAGAAQAPAQVRPVVAPAAPAAAAAAVCPVVTDRLHAAADKRVDVDRVTPEPVHRASCGQLYRADGRAPAVVFEEGFHPKAPLDGQYDLESYVLVNQPSPFVSTTYDHDLYKQWKSAWNYYIDAPGGIDVNRTIGDTHQWADQQEVAFPGGIAREFVVGACPVDRQAKREIMSGCVDNPHYRPWRG